MQKVVPAQEPVLVISARSLMLRLKPHLHPLPLLVSHTLALVIKSKKRHRRIICFNLRVGCMPTPPANAAKVCSKQINLRSR